MAKQLGETVKKSLFNPGNSIELFSLNQKYLLDRRNKVIDGIETKLENTFLEGVKEEAIDFLKTDKMSKGIEKKCQKWLGLSRLCLLQLLYGKSSLMGQFVERFAEEMKGKDDVSISLGDKMTLFQLLAFLKTYRLEDYLKIEDKWPSTLNRVAKMSGTFPDYYMLASLIKLKSADKQIMEYSIMDGYYVPLVLKLPDTGMSMPLVLSSPKIREEGTLMDQVNDFIYLLILRQHFKDREALICEYHHEKPEHIRDLAKVINKRLSLTVYE